MRPTNPIPIVSGSKFIKEDVISCGCANHIYENHVMISYQCTNDIYYYNNGHYSREDGPAIEYSNGNKEYFINGKRHRLDGPALENTNGTKEYWVNGKIHRENGPALEYCDGTVKYYIHHTIHRVKGPAVIFVKDNRKEWYKNNQRHRFNAPAIIDNYVNEYYEFGKRKQIRF